MFLINKTRHNINLYNHNTKEFKSLIRPSEKPIRVYEFCGENGKQSKIYDNIKITEGYGRKITLTSLKESLSNVAPRSNIIVSREVLHAMKTQLLPYEVRALGNHTFYAPDTINARVTEKSGKLLGVSGLIKWKP